MTARSGFFGLVVVLVLAQSCTNDFDKFEITSGGAATSSGGKPSFAGTASNVAGTARGGTPSLGGSPSLGGTLSGGGKTALAGNTSASGASADGGASAGVGAGGLSGAAGEPAVPCGGPCTLDHATAECVEDACAIAQCQGGWGDCNVDVADGCEHAVDLDPENCGACQRACAATNVAAVQCQLGGCSSSCAPGFANCTQKKTPDDGCETPVTSDAANCGGCNNKCPVGFVCHNGQCGCDFKNDCGNGNGVECVDDVCRCDLVACRPGERCRDAQGSKACSCNGSLVGCLANELCCSAGGCTDVQSNSANCGACGRACSAGFICVAGACQCDSAEDCGGEAPSIGAGGITGAGGLGAAGDTGAPVANVACVAGMCVCNGDACLEGQRCLPNGTCG